MPNLMVQDNGAYGDQGFKIPALWELRPHFDQIWIAGRHWAIEAMMGTGVADGFVIKPENWDDMTKSEKRRFLESATRDMEFDEVLNTIECIPGRLCFHRNADSRAASIPTEQKRMLNRGRNYFDEMSLHLGVPAAVGKRPKTVISEREKRFLVEFRADHNIPADAFLLGWQFTGSTIVKWYPFFYEVIQQNIMERFPFVYVVGLGDLKAEFQWDRAYHKGRFINMYDLVSFREAYLLTSIFDCFVTPDTGIFIFSQCFPETPKILLSTIVAGENIICGDETTVIQSAAECSPCYQITLDCKKDGDNPWAYCMGKIHPQRVIDAIEAQIENGDKPIYTSDRRRDNGIE